MRTHRRTHTHTGPTRAPGRVTSPASRGSRFLGFWAQPVFSCAVRSPGLPGHTHWKHCPRAPGPRPCWNAPPVARECPSCHQPPPCPLPGARPGPWRQVGRGPPGGTPERARSSHTRSPPSEHQASGQRAPPLSRHCGLAGSRGCGHGGHLGPLLHARPSPDSMSGESLPVKTAWPVSRGVCRCRRSRVVAVRAVYEAGSGQGSCMFCPTPTDSLSGNEMLY